MNLHKQNVGDLLHPKNRYNPQEMTNDSFDSPEAENILATLIDKFPQLRIDVALSKNSAISQAKVIREMAEGTRAGLGVMIETKMDLDGKPILKEITDGDLPAEQEMKEEKNEQLIKGLKALRQNTELAIRRYMTPFKDCISGRARV